MLMRALIALLLRAVAPPLHATRAASVMRASMMQRRCRRYARRRMLDSQLAMMRQRQQQLLLRLCCHAMSARRWRCCAPAKDTQRYSAQR